MSPADINLLRSIVRVLQDNRLGRTTLALEDLIRRETGQVVSTPKPTAPSGRCEFQGGNCKNASVAWAYNDSMRYSDDTSLRGPYGCCLKHIEFCKTYKWRLEPIPLTNAAIPEKEQPVRMIEV